MKKKIKGLSKLPDSPGVYLFKGRGGKILYIGKATSLRDRVRSYLRGDLAFSRGPIIEKMADVLHAVDFRPTNSVLEALILEAALIKKHGPPYNSQEKDNKSFSFLVITDEKFPRVLARRGRAIAHSNEKLRAVFGPFPSGKSLNDALKIIRKIFPYRDTCRPVEERPSAVRQNRPPVFSRPCFNHQIGLCPGVCTGEISPAEYRRTIRRIELFFEGKSERLARNIEKDMKILAKKRAFEKAAALRGTLFALRHIRDVSLVGDDIKQVSAQSDSLSGDVSDVMSDNASVGTSGSASNIASPTEKIFRIEAYDIAHIGGRSTVGVMAVLENGEINRPLGRRFKIRGMYGKNGQIQNDDIANLREVLERRFGHPEWRLPDIVVIDGGETHRKAAQIFLRDTDFAGRVVSVVKDEKHRPRQILHGEQVLRGEQIFSNAQILPGKQTSSGAPSDALNKLILLANDEAHRQAIGYHRVRRRKDFGI